MIFSRERHGLWLAAACVGLLEPLGGAHAAVAEAAQRLVADEVAGHQPAERLQHGLSSGAVEWVHIGRGFGRDIQDKEALRGKTGTSEVYIRAQMRAWLAYMTPPSS